MNHELDGLEVIPGSDCPEHLVRYATTAAIRRVAERLGLPYGPEMQDWDVEVAEYGRIADLIGAYDGRDLSDDDRFVIMEVLVASVDDGVALGQDVASAWEQTSALLRREPCLHAATLSYWACGSDPDPDHQFAITPRIRPLWRELLADERLAAPR